jgi:hypothetical protein
VAQQSYANLLNCRLETIPFERPASGIDAEKDQSRNGSAPTDDQFSEILVLRQQYSQIFMGQRDGVVVGYARRKFRDINDIVISRAKRCDQECVNAFVREPAHNTDQP